jgi:hypothetical protein
MPTMKLATDFKGYLDLQIADGHLSNTWRGRLKLRKHATSMNQTLQKPKNYGRVTTISEKQFLTLVFLIY